MSPSTECVESIEFFKASNTGSQSDSESVGASGGSYDYASDNSTTPSTSNIFVHDPYNFSNSFSGMPLGYEIDMLSNNSFSGMPMVYEINSNVVSELNCRRRASVPAIFGTEEHAGVLHQSKAATRQAKTNSRQTHLQARSLHKNALGVPKNKEARPSDEASNGSTGQRSSSAQVAPVCAHVANWKRLRAKRGYAYFVCYQCGAKWRTLLREEPAHGPQELA